MARSKNEEPRHDKYLRKVGHLWHYHFRLKGRAYHGSTRCRDLASARAYVEEARFQARQETESPAKMSMKVDEAALAWVQYLKARGRSPRHQALASSAMVSVVIPAIGDVLICDLTQDHADLVLAAARSKTSRWGHAWADATVNQALIYFRTFLSWARKRGKLRQNIQVELVGQGHQDVKVTLTAEQLGAFLAAIDQRRDPSLSLIVRAMAFLGLRVSEAVGMEWERWDAKRHLYTPRPSTTKNRKLLPVTVPAELAQMIQAHPKEGPLIAPGPGGEPLGRRAVYYVIRRIAEHLGVKGFSPHGLRRTMATLLAEAGMNPKALQEAMRHSNISVTMKHYVHTNAEQVRSGIDALAASVSKGPEQAATNIQPLRKTGTDDGDRS